MHTYLKKMQSQNANQAHKNFIIKHTKMKKQCHPDHAKKKIAKGAHQKFKKKTQKMPKIHKQCKTRYIVSLCRNYYNAVRGGQWRIVEDMHVL